MVFSLLVDWRVAKVSEQFYSIGCDLRGKFSEQQLLSSVCKFCRRNASQVGWARTDGGKECGECRNILRSLLVGSADQKGKQKTTIHEVATQKSVETLGLLG